MNYETFDRRVLGLDVDAAIAAVLVFVTLMLAYATLLWPWTVRGILAGHGAVVAAAMAYTVIKEIKRSSSGGDSEKP